MTYEREAVLSPSVLLISLEVHVLEPVCAVVLVLYF